jgi:hypothetical protein
MTVADEKSVSYHLGITFPIKQGQTQPCVTGIMSFVGKTCTMTFLFERISYARVLGY